MNEKIKEIKEKAKNFINSHKEELLIVGAFVSGFLIEKKLKSRDIKRLKQKNLKYEGIIENQRFEIDGLHKNNNRAWFHVGKCHYKLFYEGKKAEKL